MVLPWFYLRNPGIFHDLPPHRSVLGVVVGVLVRRQPRGQGLETLAAHDEDLGGEALGVEVLDSSLAR